MICIKQIIRHSGDTPRVEKMGPFKHAMIANPLMRNQINDTLVYIQYNHFYVTRSHHKPCKSITRMVN